MDDKIVTLADVLASPNASKGWLFLEPEPWTPATKGIFVDFDKDADPADDDVPAWAEEKGWIETLDVNTIEEIVFNATSQLRKPTTDQLAEAFTFYFENDAFKEF
jgi:hypothetical protein